MTSGSGPNKHSRLQPLTKRVVAVFGFIAFLYFTIGSALYVDWFYGLLWNGKFWDASYWADGVWFWLDDHTILVALGIAAALAAVVIVYRFRVRIFPLFDRIAGWLILCALAGILITGLIVYKFGRPKYEFWQNVQLTMTKLDAAMQQLFAVGAPPVINGPIDFQYLDKGRAEALYNQVESDLVEEQRTVGGGTNLTAKAGVKTAGIEGEAGVTKNQASTSTFQRLSFTPERKCLEVMKYTLGHNPNHYFSDGSTWFAHKLMESMKQQYEEAKKQPPSREITEADLEKLREIRPLGQPPTKQEQEESKRRIDQYAEEFKTEMTSLQGLVFIDGDFAITRLPQGNLLLVEAFAEKPRHVTFRVIAPTTPELSQLASLKKTRLRVFGTVVKPLDDDGNIEVRPIAVY